MNFELFKLFGVDKKFIISVLVINMVVFSSLAYLSVDRSEDTVSILPENQVPTVFTTIEDRIYWIVNYVTNGTHTWSILYEMQDNKISEYIIYTEILADGGYSSSKYSGESKIIGVYNNKLYIEFTHRGDFQLHYKFIFEFTQENRKLMILGFNSTLLNQVSQMSDKGILAAYGKKSGINDTVYYMRYSEMKFDNYDQQSFNSTTFSSYVTVENTYDYTLVELDTMFGIEIIRPETGITLNQYETIKYLQIVDERIYILYTHFLTRNGIKIDSIVLVYVDISDPLIMYFIDTNIKPLYDIKILISDGIVLLFTDRELIGEGDNFTSARSGKLRLISIDTNNYNKTSFIKDINYTFALKATTIITELYTGTDDIQEKNNLRNSIIIAVNGYAYVNYVKIIEKNDIQTIENNIIGKYGLFQAKINIYNSTRGNITDEVIHSLVLAEMNTDKTGDNRVDIDLHAIALIMIDQQLYFRFFFRINESEYYNVADRVVS